MKLNKIVLILALMALMIICDVLVEAEPEPQIFPTIPKDPTIPVPTAKTTNTTSTSQPTTSKAPPATSSVPPSKQPIQPSTPPLSTPPLTPTPTPTPTPTTSQAPPPVQSPSNSCSKSNRICPDSGMFCNVSLRQCQPKGGLGDSCRNDNECLDPFVCSKNSGCQYNDSNQNDKHYNVKKVAIIGAIVVGVSGACGLIFFVYRQFKNRNDYDITSKLYSTDDDISEPDPYPFNERSNSFSNNAVQQPSRAPPKAHYDNLPPARNRNFAVPHQGYNNYYNEYNNNNNNEGRYMRQNENGNVTRTMNLLQQTRGNVVVTPPQNYNWNPPPVQQPQGGLFPIPSVKGNYGVPISPNNTKNYNNNDNSSENLNHNQPKASSSYSVDYSVNRNNQNVRTDPPRELSKDPSTSQNPSNLKHKKNSSTNRDSFFDYYARDSFFAKSLENKLPIFKRSKNNLDPERNIPATVHDTASRIQTFGHDPKLVKSPESSTVEEAKKVI